MDSSAPEEEPAVATDDNANGTPVEPSETEEVPDMNAGEDEELPADEDPLGDTYEDGTEDAPEEAPATGVDDATGDTTDDTAVDSDTTTPDQPELGDDEVDPDEDANEDDDLNDELGEPMDDDGVDTDITVDGDTENNGKLFDELDKEEDVQKAITLIRQRVADAEETFIRNNAEDKKKVEELINKISTNVKTVEDMADKDETKAKIAEESARMNKRAIDNIRDNRPLTVFEKMSRNLTASIVKDKALLESKYTTEDGKLDVDLVIESSKVMFGFLETLNTLQLANVNEKYIEKVLNEM